MQQLLGHLGVALRSPELASLPLRLMSVSMPCCDLLCHSVLGEVRTMVARFRAGAPPSNTNTGWMPWNSSRLMRRRKPGVSLATTWRT